MKVDSKYNKKVLFNDAHNSKTTVFPDTARMVFQFPNNGKNEVEMGEFLDRMAEAMVKPLTDAGLDQIEIYCDIGFVKSKDANGDN